MLPGTMLHHLTNAPWLRALDLTVEDSAGPIAALTLKRCWMPGPVRLLLRTVHETGPGTLGADPTPSWQAYALPGAVRANRTLAALSCLRPSLAGHQDRDGGWATGAGRPNTGTS